MRATSEASLAAALDRFEPVLSSAGQGARSIGEEIFAVVDALDSSTSLRRALTDPTRNADSKAELAQSLLAGKASDDVCSLIAGMARSRWSGDRDFADALEEIGTAALLVAAQDKGELLRLEDELFRLGRVLAGERELRIALASAEYTGQRRTQLADSLISEQVLPETAVLVRRTVGALRQRSVIARLAQIGELAASRRKRVVANVLAASPLNQAQVERLEKSLSRLYGTDVHVNVGIDPAIVGGLRVQVGAEVVDATVLSKLHEARRRIAG